MLPCEYGCVLKMWGTAIWGLLTFRYEAVSVQKLQIPRGLECNEK
jgi:hypothetical protein